MILKAGSCFWIGYAFHMCITNGIMDWVGKEKYLMLADATWVDTQWWYWIIGFVFFNIILLGGDMLVYKLKIK